VPAGKQSHLLHHTSGLRDQWSLLELAGWRMSQDLITDDDVMSVVSGRIRYSKKICCLASAGLVSSMKLRLLRPLCWSPGRRVTKELYSTMNNIPAKRVFVDTRLDSDWSGPLPCRWRVGARVFRPYCHYRPAALKFGHPKAIANPMLKSNSLKGTGGECPRFCGEPCIGCAQTVSERGFHR
jgi:hypothetical protein